MWNQSIWVKMFDRVVAAFVNSAGRAYYGQYFYADKWHPHHALLKEAQSETVAYIKAHMRQAMVLKGDREVLAYACEQVDLEGLHLEFGVRTGNSINHLARLRPAWTLHGFDSFKGLPENWTGWSVRKGAFGGEGMPDVRDNVQLVVGWFEDTLPEFLDRHSEDVAFIHIDSDIYSSAKTVLDHLAPRIKPGTVIVFNEYFNYPSWRDHEFKAFREFSERYQVKYEYLCWGLYEAAVKILEIHHEK